MCVLTQFVVFRSAKDDEQTRWAAVRCIGPSRLIIIAASPASHVQTSEIRQGIAMPLSLICACGARIELEDTLAGQEIACPECQQPLKAPAGAAHSQPVRTSGFALASLVLAVAGAFTIVGTLAAIVLGVVAVISIMRQRDRLAGLGYAIAGIVIGLIFTPL